MWPQLRKQGKLRKKIVNAIEKTVGKGTEAEEEREEMTKMVGKGKVAGAMITVVMIVGVDGRRLMTEMRVAEENETTAEVAAAAAAAAETEAARTTAAAVERPGIGTEAEMAAIEKMVGMETETDFGTERIEVELLHRPPHLLSQSCMASMMGK